MGVTSNVAVVEVLNAESLVQETSIVTHVIEVVRSIVEPTETVKSANVIDIVRPGGTVLNVGAGPVLPSSPYEGQIWIKT